ncbi:MAG: hypothetical protein KGR18_02310 [Acidobacteria bacterium]|nr:hypothetical protein [Acidobacteriota bacterium]
MRPTLRRLPGVLAATLLATLAIALLGATGPAGAAGPGTVISPGLNTTGATVTAADGSTRTVSSTDAAGMMQPLVASMYFGTPQFTDPPATATRSTIVFDWVFTAQTPSTSGTLTVDYAQQGTTGWVALPAQALWPGAGIMEETAGKWFVISPSFVSAFNGQATVETFAPDGGGSNGSSSSSSINGALVVGVIVLAVLVLAGALVVRRRRTDTATR